MPDATHGNGLHADRNGQPIAYEVRHIAMPKDKATKIIPYVLSALQTVGVGSAVAGDEGLQVTAPIDLLHHLAATINKYIDSPRTFENCSLLDPLLAVTGVSTNFKPIIDALGLCPPDIRCEWFPLGDFGGVLAFAGPEGRQSHFTTKVLPSIKGIIPPLKHNTFYAQLVDVPKTTVGFKQIVDGLGLCPPDMRCVHVQTDDGKRNCLVFSGPKDRENHYRTEVLPSVRALVNLLTAP